MDIGIHSTVCMYVASSCTYIFAMLNITNSDDDIITNDIITNDIIVNCHGTWYGHLTWQQQQQNAMYALTLHADSACLEGVTQPSNNSIGGSGTSVVMCLLFVGVSRWAQEPCCCWWLRKQSESR